MNPEDFYVRDYIEELPNNIDIEIGHYLTRIPRIQLDKVGVFSFACTIIRDQNDDIPEIANSNCCLCPKSGKNRDVNNKVNIIVNIYT